MATLDPGAPPSAVQRGQRTLQLPIPGPITAELGQALSNVLNERARQIDLWGEQNHGPWVWLPILTEEVGEVAKELADARLSDFRRSAYRNELVHVAAVAVAAIEALDRGCI
jgi:hypothetical protein